MKVNQKNSGCVEKKILNGLAAGHQQLACSCCWLPNAKCHHVIMIQLLLNL